MLITGEGTIVYALYYMMCICGPVDMAKVELLKTNLKVAGMLYGVLCGFQCVVQAFFLEELIEKFLNFDFFKEASHFYTISAVNLACTVIAFCSIFGIVQEELKELRTFRRSKAGMRKSGQPEESEEGVIIQKKKLRIVSQMPGP